jgi:hypothetical protein
LALARPPGLPAEAWVRDATAAFTHQMMHAAHELNGPTYAHSIPTTEEVITTLPKASRAQEKV